MILIYVEVFVMNQYVAGPSKSTRLIEVSRQSGLPILIAVSECCGKATRLRMPKATYLCSLSQPHIKPIPRGPS